MKLFTTIPQVLDELHRYKPLSRQALYTYLRKLDIKPLGDLRQRPQLYPADTASKILKRLGLR